MRDFHVADEEIEFRLRGGQPETLTDLTLVALWDRKEELAAAITANEVAFPHIDRSIRTFAAWRRQ